MSTTDTAPCIERGEHVSTQRHTRFDCPCPCPAPLPAAAPVKTLGPRQTRQVKQDALRIRLYAHDVEKNLADGDYATARQYLGALVKDTARLDAYLAERVGR